MIKIYCPKAIDQGPKVMCNGAGRRVMIDVLADDPVRFKDICCDSQRCYNCPFYSETKLSEKR